jgi:transposase
MRDIRSDPTVNYHGGNTESAAAYVSLARDLNRLRKAVRDYVRTQGDRGATCEEIEDGLGLSHQTVSARCTEGKRDGWLLATDVRRATRSGRSARVLVTP